MSLISPVNIKAVLANFLDERVIPAIPQENTLIRWGLTGSASLVLTQTDRMIEQYAPLLKTFGILNEENLLDTEKVKLFIDTAFQKEPEVRINIMGIPFRFSLDDGKALLEIIKRYEGTSCGM
jgi:hypothetical protein